MGFDWDCGLVHQDQQYALLAICTSMHDVHVKTICPSDLCESAGWCSRTKVMRMISRQRASWRTTGATCWTRSVQKQNVHSMFQYLQWNVGICLGPVGRYGKALGGGGERGADLPHLRSAPLPSSADQAASAAGHCTTSCCCCTSAREQISAGEGMLH